MQESDSKQTFQAFAKTNRTNGWAQEKQHIEQLEKKLAESEEGKRLLEMKMEKLVQREKNSIFLLESQIQDLKRQNQSYSKTIDGLQKEIRLRKGNSISQSNLNRSVIRSSRKNMRISADKQNLNLLNMDQSANYVDAGHETNEQRDQMCQRIYNSLQSLLNSIKIRVIDRWHIEDYEYWAKQLEQQKQNRKKDCGKGSLPLLTKIQQKIQAIQYFFQNGSEKGQREVLSHRLAKSIKQLRMKTAALMQVPFLEKIDIEDRKASYECLKTDARAKKESILAMMHSK